MEFEVHRHMFFDSAGIGFFFVCEAWVSIENHCQPTPPSSEPLDNVFPHFVWHSTATNQRLMYLKNDMRWFLMLKMLEGRTFFSGMNRNLINKNQFSKSNQHQLRLKNIYGVVTIKVLNLICKIN